MLLSPTNLHVRDRELVKVLNTLWEEIQNLNTASEDISFIFDKENKTASGCNTTSCIKAVGNSS